MKMHLLMRKAHEVTASTIGVMAALVCLISGEVVHAKQSSDKAVSAVPYMKEVNGSYLSTQLLLKPCANYSSESGVDTQKQVEATRRQLPRGACSAPGIPEAVFKARFLQYASIASSSDPVQIFDVVTRQNRQLANCKNVGCLRVWAKNVSSELERNYISAWNSLGAGGHPDTRCTARNELTPEILAAHIGSDMVKRIKSACDPDAYYANECDGVSKKKTIDVFCEVSGNAVNSPSWILGMDSGQWRSILYDDNGSFYEMSQTCNGINDMKTDARVSMGESDVTIYRFDGTEYRKYFSYINESVGPNWRIARYPSKADMPPTCGR